MRARSDYFRRGTAAHAEATKILGAQCDDVLDESVRQINRRWLKATFIVRDSDGYPMTTGHASGHHRLVTVNRRVRIPCHSPLARPRP